MMPKVRKQIHELTLTDLEQHPVWEFALDEEGIEGQDEATVRLVDQDLGPRQSDMRIVRANFDLADGTSLCGYLYARTSFDMSIGDIQPTVITEVGQVHFWHGTLKPGRGAMDKAFAMLGRTCEQIFPLSFASDDGTVSGTLAGFMFLDRRGMPESSIR